MTDISPTAAASLGTAGHIYCAGTASQCVSRWNRLPEEKKAGAFLKMGRDGVPPTIVRGEELQELAAKLLDRAK